MHSYSQVLVRETPRGLLRVDARNSDAPPLPRLIERIWNRKINPGKVFDLTLPLDQVAEGYRAMDGSRAVQALLLP